MRATRLSRTGTNRPFAASQRFRPVTKALTTVLAAQPACLVMALPDELQPSPLHKAPRHRRLVPLDTGTRRVARRGEASHRQ